MGTWRGCTLVYSGNDKHCKFRDGRNDIVGAEASSQRAVNQKKTSTNPFYCIYLMLPNVLLEETGQWALGIITLLNENFV